MKRKSRFIMNGLLNTIVCCIAAFASIAFCADTASISIASDSSRAAGHADSAQFAGVPTIDMIPVRCRAAVPSKRIVSLSFNGNRTTHEKVLRMFLRPIGIDTGEIFDSAKAVLAKEKLLLTNLYSTVDIIPLAKDDGVHVHVMLKEVFSIIPDGVGGEIVDRKHGKLIDWYKLHLGLTFNNFRGMMETFSLGSTVWEDRALSLSWTKPLYPSPYYFGAGAVVANVQDLNFPQNRLITLGRVSLGRRLTLHSQGGVGFAPTYTRIAALDGTEVAEFREIISSIRWNVDFRNDTYDPFRGWCLTEALSTNTLYSDDAIKYGQFLTDARWYVPGIFKGNRIAFHAQAVFRTNDAGDYKRLYLGGDGSVRGFPSSWLGFMDTMNNYATISSEYRFHLLTTPEFDFGFLSGRFQELKGLYYEIDGALIADAGHLWHDFTRPLNRRQNGQGIGVGLNIKAPTLRICGSIDAVWGIYEGKLLPMSPRYYPFWHFFLSTF
jgi:outer membrane protein assembly factor BamA